MKRVLIITYYWPPTGGSGVQRWAKFAKYLPANGWQPVVYTPRNPEQAAVDESLLADLPEEVEVLRRRICEPYSWYRLLRGRRKAASAAPISGHSKGFWASLALWIRANFFVPDPRRSWVKPSLRYLKRYLQEHPVDAVVTTGPPHSMHLIGLALKQELGIKWVADFRDPWTRIYNFKHLPLLPWVKAAHRRLEQQVLDGCDAVVAVTPLVRDDFQQQTRTPVSLITNGFDEDDYPKSLPAASAGGKAGRSFTLVHTGVMARDGNPLVLWDVLARKCAGDKAFREALEIRLSGIVDAEVVDALRARGLMDRVKLLGYQAHAATVREQCRAGVLLLPLRDDAEMRKIYPGKIFEYLAARRPVLGFGQTDGVSARLLRDCGAGVMYDWQQSEPMTHFIDHCWELWQAGTLLPPGEETDLSAFSRRVLTEKLAALLAQL